MVMSNHPECCDVTFHGIHKWYTAMFEKLGWMILAKDKGLNDNIIHYKYSVKLLQQSIEKKIKDAKDSDKKADLKIMLHNVKALVKHVNKDFGKSK